MATLSRERRKWEENENKEKKRKKKKKKKEGICKENEAAEKCRSGGRENLGDLVPACQRLPSAGCSPNTVRMLMRMTLLSPTFSSMYIIHLVMT